MQVCGAKTKSGKECRHSAGYRTDHVGSGKCYLHGGASKGAPIKHGLYSRYALIKRPRIKELLDSQEQDENPLDILPEVKLLRALILDFVERYDEQTEGLIAWHASFNPRFNTGFAEWQAARDRWQELYGDWQKAFEEYRETVEQVQRFYQGGWPEPPDVPPFPDPPEPPNPADYALKPKEVPDILSAGKFITAIGSLVERVEKQRSEGAISMVTLTQVLQDFGKEMALGIMKAIPDDEPLRTAVLEEIESRWAIIELPIPQRRSP